MAEQIEQKLITAKQVAKVTDESVAETPLGHGKTRGKYSNPDETDGEIMVLKSSIQDLDTKINEIGDNLPKQVEQLQTNLEQKLKVNEGRIE